MTPKQDLTGQKFGRWTVISYDQIGSDQGKRSKWFCQCECGTKRSVLQRNLLIGHSLSCGCWNRDRDRSYSHGTQIDY